MWHDLVRALILYRRDHCDPAHDVQPSSPAPTFYHGKNIRYLAGSRAHTTIGTIKAHISIHAATDALPSRPAVLSLLLSHKDLHKPIYIVGDKVVTSQSFHVEGYIGGGPFCLPVNLAHDAADLEELWGVLPFVLEELAGHLRRREDRPPDQQTEPYPAAWAALKQKLERGGVRLKHETGGRVSGGIVTVTDEHDTQLAHVALKALCDDLGGVVGGTFQARMALWMEEGEFDEFVGVVKQAYPVLQAVTFTRL